MKQRDYPEEPLVGVGALVFKEGSILLVKRGNPPLAGTWSFPGGITNPFESLRDAVIREVREECNIDIEVGDLIKIFEYIERDKEERVKYHYIVFDFKALYKGGTLSHSSDALETKWVKLDELSKYKLTEAVKEVIKEGL